MLSNAGGRPRSKEVPRRPPVHRPFAYANHESRVQERRAVLPFPYVCVNCGSALVNIESRRLMLSDYICDPCRKERSHATYLWCRDTILARGMDRYHRIKGSGPVTASVLTRKTKVLRAILAGGLDQITGDEDIKCSNCGCNEILFLEINHRKGGGTKESRLRGRMITLGQAIIKGRPVQDLNILCGPCNRLEYLKRRYPGRHYPHVLWSSD